MPHSRKRQILPLLEKRLRLFPVVGLVGARQTGKSTILRDQMVEHRKIKYLTLDREEELKRATEQPTLFLQQAEESSNAKTVCIDEAQKAPKLFDAVKAEVDEKKIPGRFILSGSTEFSKKTGIQESLTGRIALLRLFPLNLQEIYPDKKTFSLSEIHRWCERGGMPGMFAVRDEAARESFMDEWIDTTCTRDMARFKIPGFNPDLARRVFVELTQAEIPDRLTIARAVGKTPRQIESYLQALKALFVIYEIAPHPTSVGKPFFYPLDAGLAKNMGASFHRCLQIWFLNQCFSFHAYHGKTRPDLFHYETTRGSRIDFIVTTKTESTAFLLNEKEAPSTYDLRAAFAFTKKHSKIKLSVLAPCLRQHSLSDQVQICPWGTVPFKD